MDRQDEASTEMFNDTFAGPEMATREPLFTMGRIVNGAIALVCLAGMISSIVCLAIMAHKHNEIIDYTDPGHSNSGDNEVCILFASLRETSNNGSLQTYEIKYNRSHACQFVIFGSGVIAGLLLLAVVYHIVRLFLWLSINPLVFSEVAGFGVLLILAFSIAVVASTGRAYTCDHVATNGKYNNDCKNIKVYYNNNEGSDRDPIYIYSALKTSEISAWISFLLLLALVIVTVVKMVIWFMRRSARRRDERQLDNLISPNNEDDDEDPLPM